MTRKIAGHDEVVKMAQGGMAPAEIAQETGVTINTVYGDIYNARKAGIQLPEFPRGRTRMMSHNLYLPVRVLSTLEAAAKERELTVHSLAGMILTTIANDNLITAVLDDGDTHG